MTEVEMAACICLERMDVEASDCDPTVLIVSTN